MFIPYGKQEITEADIESVVSVLKSDFLTQGPKIEEFEASVSGYCGAEYGIACSSATAALHLACLSLGLGVGDRLWTSPITFVASANCALYCGARVEFVDIDPQTYNMSVDALEEKLILAEKEGVLPKVVIPVHFAGQSCDMKKIHELSLKYGFRIIEDASHAVGGSYLKSKVGSCEFSDITIFSFHPVKIITTAEGGCAVSNSSELYSKMSLLRSHGITRDSDLMIGNEAQGGWYYEQIELGFNYRMTELQAALGCSQIKRLDEFVVRRHELKAKYDSALKELPLILPYQSSDRVSSLHLYPIVLDKSARISRSDAFNEMRLAEIGVNVHYIPVHLQPFYMANYGFKRGDFPEAERYYDRCISIPLYYGLREEMQTEVINVCQRLFK